jgi:hypothetical protein
VKLPQQPGRAARAGYYAGLPLLLCLQACVTTPTISDVAVQGLMPRAPDFCGPHHGPTCPPALAEFPQFVPLGQQITIHPIGQGTCGVVSIDFGDGTPAQLVQNLPMGTAGALGLGVQHTYTGWPGRKRIRVQGITNCVGDEAKEVMVATGPMDRGDFDLGFVPNNMVCNPVPNVPPLRTGTTVKIWADSYITYGPLLSFDAGGQQGVATPSDFPFPSMTKFSVIYQIGSQQIQGSSRASPVFRVAATGPLEICLNDHPSWLSDNRGGGHFVITVNETTAQ